MAVFYSAPAMTESQAIGKYLEEMYEIAEKISAARSQMHEHLTDPLAFPALSGRA